MKNGFFVILVIFWSAPASGLSFGWLTEKCKKIVDAHVSTRSGQSKGYKVISHLACIMDGNRRWAKKRVLQPWLGHKEGVKAVREAVAFCVEKKIKHLSLYTFSLENFNRPQKELDFLFNTLVGQVMGELDELIESGVRITFVGDRSKFPERVQSAVAEVEEKTRHLSKLNLQILFCYGGRQELVAGVKRIAQAVKEGLMHPEQIDEKTIADHLWMAGTPDPELIVRTGGAHRLSNFLPFQAVYSELYFLDKLWPEVKKQDFENALEYYTQCKRNFGA